MRIVVKFVMSSDAFSLLTITILPTYMYYYYYYYYIPWLVWYQQDVLHTTHLVVLFYFCVLCCLS